MYLPEHFREARVDLLHKWIRQRAFGTLVTAGPNGPEANHMPFMLDVESPTATSGVLKCHIARKNPLWQTIGTDNRVLVIFQGPDAYVSPNWYPTKQENAKVVPTWNYAAVHVQGTVKAIHEPEWLLAHLTELTRQQEKPQEAPWQVSDAPADFINKMMGAIVGLEIKISQITGKCKASQNQPARNKEGVKAGLGELGTPSAVAMAELIR